MCFGYTILTDCQRSAATRLRVIEGIARRIHIDEFQADLNIGAVLFQLDASAGFKRDCAAAYFCTCSFRSGFTIRFRVIAARNGQCPARRLTQIGNLFINLCNVRLILIDFRIHCFQLCDIDRVGVFRTCRESCQLTGIFLVRIADRNRASRRFPCFGGGVGFG